MSKQESFENVKENLPASQPQQTLVARFAKAASSLPQPPCILRFDQKGTHRWLYGIEDVLVPEGNEVAVNIENIQAGYVNLYTKPGDEMFSEKRGEALVNFLYNDIPQIASLPDLGGSWKKCYRLYFKGLSQDIENQEFSYDAISVSACIEVEKFIKTAATAIAKASADPDPKDIPVISLQTSYFDHKKYNKIYTPKFKLLAVMNQAGERATV